MSDPFTPWPPSEEDIAWLVGILEGEGSFCKVQGRVCLSLGMNDEDVVSKAAKMMGISYHVTTYGPNKTRRYSFMILGRARAGRIMGTIYPLMGERRRGQIQKALQFDV